MVLILCAAALTGHLHFNRSSRISHSVETCPFCGLDIVKDSDGLKYRVTMEIGGKKTPYRCILCALGDGKTEAGDLDIVAPSQDKEKPVKITRKDGKWTLDPDTAVFAYAKGSHSECQIRYRALTSEKAFEDYQAKFPKMFGSSKPISLADLIKKAE